MAEAGESGRRDTGVSVTIETSTLTSCGRITNGSIA